MDNPKYIIHDGVPYIFPAFVDHSEFARRNMLHSEDIQGAGFVRLYDGDPMCYGESGSLGIKSRDEVDTERVKKLFKMGDYLYS